jgi:hypothetical protein
MEVAMRGKVREIPPDDDAAGLETIDVVMDPQSPADDGSAGPERPGRAPSAGRRRAAVQGHPEPGSAPGMPERRANASVPRARRRPPVAADLGPDGDVVLGLLWRAAALTEQERRRLDHEASWRWGMATPVLGPGQVPVARARAHALGRAVGRAGAIRELEDAVASMPWIDPRHAGQSRTARTAVLDACLAVLTRDLLDPEVFEVLFGPWGEVMHH